MISFMISLLNIVIVCKTIREESDSAKDIQEELDDIKKDVKELKRKSYEGK